MHTESIGISDVHVSHLCKHNPMSLKLGEPRKESRKKIHYRSTVFGDGESNPGLPAIFNGARGIKSGGVPCTMSDYWIALWT